jgi:hypothetical protein
VYFCTCQHGIVTANQPPFNDEEPSKPSFNDHNIFLGGDSGSPEMLVTASGALVFVKGRDASGPSGQMQTIMNLLCTSRGLNPSYYQLSWYSIP